MKIKLTLSNIKAKDLVMVKLNKQILFLFFKHCDTNVKKPGATKEKGDAVTLRKNKYLTFICLKSTIKTLEKGVKCVQRLQ